MLQTEPIKKMQWHQDPQPPQRASELWLGYWQTLQTLPTSDMWLSEKRCDPQASENLLLAVQKAIMRVERVWREPVSAQDTEASFCGSDLSSLVLAELAAAQYPEVA